MKFSEEACKNIKQQHSFDPLKSENEAKEPWVINKQCFQTFLSIPFRVCTAWNQKTLFFSNYLSLSDLKLAQISSLGLCLLSAWLFFFFLDVHRLSAPFALFYASNLLVGFHLYLSFDSFSFACLLSGPTVLCLSLDLKRSWVNHPRHPNLR